MAVDHADSSASTGGPVVLLDFDGTLARREGMWRGALLAALDQVDAGHTVTMETLRDGLRDAFPWHAPTTPHIHLDTPELWWAELRGVFRRAYAAAGVNAAVAERAADHVAAGYLDHRSWNVFDDVRPALERLRAGGYRNVILSNHVPELADLVNRIGLGDLIDVVVTSAITGYEKPHPAMFEFALDLTGRPETVWMIGDNPTADIDGATAAGIPAILVRRPDADGRSIGLIDAVDLIANGGHSRRGHQPLT